MENYNDIVSLRNYIGLMTSKLSDRYDGRKLTQVERDLHHHMLEVSELLGQLAEEQKAIDEKAS